MATKKKQPAFNDLLETLEAIVDRLENGDPSLEDSLEAFEKGVALTQQAQKLLADAEQKVLLLTQGDEGEPEITELEDDEDDL